jgi:uncharacterized protein (TIGR03435 family)
MRFTFILFSALLAAQTPTFEVASIRVSDQDNKHSSNTTKGLFRTHNVTVRSLIMRAYDVLGEEITGGPDWVGSVGFDINAKIPAEFVEDRKSIPVMIQGLLAERFGLAIHREPREASGFFLVTAKKGPKMTPAKDTTNGSTNTQNTHMVAKNTTMEDLARFLSRDQERIVVDKTGLTGGFDFELEWAENPTDDRPSMVTALQEQLGLKLEAAKVPYSAVVIDKAVKPEAN